MCEPERRNAQEAPKALSQVTREPCPRCRRESSPVLPGLAFRVSLPALPCPAPGALPRRPAPRPRDAAGAGPSQGQLPGDHLCALQDEVRWRTPAWSDGTCRQTADAVHTAARKYTVTGADRRGDAERERPEREGHLPYYRDGTVYAKDGGLNENCP